MPNCLTPSRGWYLPLAPVVNIYGGIPIDRLALILLQILVRIQNRP